ncbi:hypothetical protein D3C71_2238730 [compost metagenome]
MRRQADFAELGHRLAFVLQQTLGQVPATVQWSHQLGLGNFHGVEEHLAER